MTESEKHPPSHPRRKYWISGIIVAIVAVYVVSQYFGPYTRLMRHVRSGDLAKRLGDWAGTILEHPPEGPKREVSLDMQDLPEFVKSLPSVITASYVKKQSGAEDYVKILCGNRYYHYGVVVGRPGFTPPDNNQLAFEKVGDGVWGFSPTPADKGGGE